MRYLRRSSPRRLWALAATLVALAAVGGLVSRTAFGQGGSAPPPAPLNQAILNAVTATAPTGVSARLSFTNHVVSGGLPGSSSALLSGATGRVWVQAGGRFRAELQSTAGDVQIVGSPSGLTVYDASSNTLYQLPHQADTSEPATPDTAHAAPTLAEIDKALARLGQVADIGAATPGVTGSQGSYSVRLTPKDGAGLLGAVELAWDATHGIPLRAGIYARGQSAPVLEVAVTDITFGAVPDSDVDLAPPAGAKVVDLSSTVKDLRAQGQGQGSTTKVEGLDAVRAAASFPVLAPDTLGGLARTHVMLLKPSDGSAQTAIVRYGQGLGTLLVVERPKDATAGAAGHDPLAQLPGVTINGSSGHELATALGTAVTFTRNGTLYAVAGSVDAATAESAARALAG